MLICIHCWKNGKPASALHVTIIFPLQKLKIQEPSVTQGHMLSVADIIEGSELHIKMLARPLGSTLFPWL